METKACVECGVIAEIGRTCKCTKCMKKARQFIWREKNLEREREKDKIRRNLPETKAARSEYAKKYYKENPDKWDEGKRDLANRAKYISTWTAINKERISGLRAERVRTLSNGYVAEMLRLKKKDCTPELISMKREQLEMHRLSKQLNEALKECDEGRDE